MAAVPTFYRTDQFCIVVRFSYRGMIDVTTPIVHLLAFLHKSADEDGSPLVTSPYFSRTVARGLVSPLR
jgi:hypothetical protein